MPLLNQMEPIVKKFYDGVAEGKYYGRKCKECGAIEFPPHLACNTCGYHETEWVELSGHGTLQSFVVPGIQNDKPYLKALGAYGYGAVKLDEGPVYTFVVYAGKKKVAKKIKVNAKTGKITVTKKAKKGTYKVKVQVNSAESANYNPCSKTVAFKVKVK